MTRAWFTFILCLLMSTARAGNLHVAIVQGLPGTAEYGEQFDAQAEQVKRSAEALAGAGRVKTFRGAEAQRNPVLEHLGSYAALAADDRVAVFLIGHGSYDGFEYKFNLPGPDLTGTDLATHFDQIGAGTQLLVNTSSASGALLDTMKRDARILITATRSGGERHATRFGEYFAAALSNPTADINKNDVISAREAFDYAQRQVADWFEFEGRIATEHPELAGERAAQFSLARLTPVPQAADSPVLAALVKQRADLDGRIENLQLTRDSLASSDYFERLEGLLLELASVQEKIDAFEQGDDGQ
jgi:hypothetical protein